MQTPSIPQSSLPPNSAASKVSRQTSNNLEAAATQQSSGEVDIDPFDILLGQTLAATHTPPQLDPNFTGEVQIASALQANSFPVPGAFETPLGQQPVRAELTGRIPALVLPDKVESTTIPNYANIGTAVPRFNQVPLPSAQSDMESATSLVDTVSISPSNPESISPSNPESISPSNPESISPIEHFEAATGEPSNASTSRITTPIAQSTSTSQAAPTSPATQDPALTDQSPHDILSLDEAQAGTTEDFTLNQQPESGTNSPMADVAQHARPTSSSTTSVGQAQATSATISIQATDHILSARQIMVDGRATLEVELDPPELGKVTIELIEEDSQLRGKLIVAESSSMELIKSSMPDLLRTLAEAGLMFSEMELASPGQEQQQSSRRDPERVDNPQASGDSVAQDPAVSANRQHGINLIA